jgi:RNA exonuclease 4
MRITNYLTSVSGITPKHVIGSPFYDQKEIEKVKKLLEGRIIVGHSLNSDFKAMKMEDEKF